MTPYIGRFAPSPTGPLHEGSLLAAVASYTDAKANHGQWLLRIEDVDRFRIVSGASQCILTTLEQHGLYWDGEVQYQTDNNDRYQAALDQLQHQQQLFFCHCTRTMLRQHPGPYPGFCRTVTAAQYLPATAQQPASHAIRFACADECIHFSDRILGPQSFELTELGDFILRRRDSLFAYQLAVVIDDADQSITHVVRGVDLLPSTPWQIALQKALNLPSLNYAHVPLITKANSHHKLSKQTGAKAISNKNATSNICLALHQLGQKLPEEAHTLTPDQLLTWAIDHWKITAIPTTPVTCA